jgi:hypothetical protein
LWHHWIKIMQPSDSIFEYKKYILLYDLPLLANISFDKQGKLDTW